MPMTYRQAEDFIEIVKKNGKVFHFQLTLAGPDVAWLSATRVKERNPGGIIGRVLREGATFYFKGRRMKARHLKALKFFFREHFGKRYLTAPLTKEIEDDDEDDDDDDYVLDDEDRAEFHQALDKLAAADTAGVLAEALATARAVLDGAEVTEEAARAAVDDVSRRAAEAATSGPAADPRVDKLRAEWVKRIEPGYAKEAEALAEVLRGMGTAETAITSMQETRRRFLAAIRKGDAAKAGRELEAWQKLRRLLPA